MLFYSIAIVAFIASRIVNVNIGAYQNFFLAISALAIVATLISQATVYILQTTVIERITEEKEKKKIFEDKSKNLLEQMRTILLVEYPDFEEKIIDKITSQDIHLLLLKFPELKTSDLVVKYIKEIKTNLSSVYDCELAVAKLKKELRIRKRTAKIYCFPILPKE